MDAGRNLPATQLVQDVLPLELTNFPLPQIKQVDSRVAPVDSEYLPSMQSMQDADDDSVLYFPEVQSEQAEASTPVAASVRYFPEEHSAQEAEAEEE